jgi:hypothetical protein
MFTLEGRHIVMGRTDTQNTSGILLAPWINNWDCQNQQAFVLVQLMSFPAIILAFFTLFLMKNVQAISLALYTNKRSH